MLPAYIIEELRRREEARKNERAQPQLELPVSPGPRREAPKDPSDRGVEIIPIFG